MKNAIIAIVCFIFMLIAVTGLLLGQMISAHAEDLDYMAIMQQAVTENDTETGVSAENARTEKIISDDLTNQIISYEDLSYLSKVIYAEAGSLWLSDEWKMSVGEVVLNRVASPEFPNTVREVIEQSGQYYGKNSRYFNGLKPDLRCVKIALRLLQGERNFDDGSVVYQANFRQGSGTHVAFFDKYLGWTYFCYTRYPELYMVK